VLHISVNRPMKLYEIAVEREIILVCGNLCSGKGHYCENKYPEFHKIVVSDIVKSIIHSSGRNELSKTKHLDQTILQILIQQITFYEKVVVDGIRQMSILKGLEDEFGRDIKDIIWLEVPENLRRARFQQRDSIKDDLDFDTAMQTDKNLGIEDVENYVKGKHRVEHY